MISAPYDQGLRVHIHVNKLGIIFQGIFNRNMQKSVVGLQFRNIFLDIMVVFSVPIIVTLI